MGINSTRDIGRASSLFLLISALTGGMGGGGILLGGLSGFYAPDVLAEASIGATASTVAGIGLQHNNGHFSAGRSPVLVTIDPLGKFAYVVNSGSKSISTYRINQRTGELTSSGENTATELVPLSLAIDPTGKFAYVANGGDKSVSAYTIDAHTGALTRVGKVASERVPLSISVSPSGKFAYVASYYGGVSSYAINSDTGVLTSIGVPVQVGNKPRSIAINPTGRFVYVANEASGNVSAFTIDQMTGALTEIDQNGAADGNAVTAGQSPISVCVDPSGHFVYVANYGSQDVSAYSIDTNTGALTEIDQSGVTGKEKTVASGNKPYSITVHPTGKYVYVANQYEGSVMTYSVNRKTGALTTLSSMDVGSHPVAVTVAPSGKFAYLVNRNSGDVAAYAIKASSGVLQQLGSTLLGDASHILDGSNTIKR